MDYHYQSPNIYLPKTFCKSTESELTLRGNEGNNITSVIAKVGTLGSRFRFLKHLVWKN